MAATRSATTKAWSAATVGAGVAALAVLAAPTASADPLSDCVRNAWGVITIDGGAPLPPIFGFEDLRLIGVDGGSGNTCITNVGPGNIHVTHPEGREPGRTEVSEAPIEMKVDGGAGNVAVTNVGTGAVIVDRNSVAPAPEAAGQRGDAEMPRLELDAGHDGVFVTNIGTGTVSVVDWDPAAGPVPEAIPLPPEVVVTDPITGNVYVTNFFGPSVTVVDRGEGGRRVVHEPDPVTALDYGTRNVFVTNIGGGSVLVVRE